MRVRDDGRRERVHAAPQLGGRHRGQFELDGRIVRGCLTLAVQADGRKVRTGVTAILPHEGNLFQEKTPAAVVVGNGFGKLMGSTQVQELGEIETPILLTCTLCVWKAADAIVEWMLEQPGMENVRSLTQNWDGNVHLSVFLKDDVTEATQRRIAGGKAGLEHARERVHRRKPVDPSLE